MASDPTDTPQNTRWEGFSNYQNVSERMAQSIEGAIRAYTFLDSRHQEGAPITPKEAAEARSKILTPALRLMAEMEEERETVDKYDEMLDRWTADDDDGDDDPGYIRRINEVKLQNASPGWLFQFVLDIRSAGFELGYLQAGRTVKEEPTDPVEGETEAMFDNL